MQEISKQFIDQLLDIVNLDADSKVRSKSGYGRFEIDEWTTNMGKGVCFTLWYKPTKIHEGFNLVVLRKNYDLTVDHLEVFQSQFYQEVVRYLTGHPDSHKLIQHGREI